MINYTDYLNRKIENIVGEFNSKIKELRAMNKTHLPKLVSIEDIKNKNRNRYELNRQLDQLRRFSEPGAEEVFTNSKGVSLTKWEWDVIAQNMRIAKRVINKQISREMASDSYYAPDNISILNAEKSYITRQQKKRVAASNKYMTIYESDRDNIKNLMSISSKFVFKKARDEKYKDSLLKMITNGLAQTGLPKEEIEQMRQDFENIDADKLADAYKNNQFVRSLVERYHFLTETISKDFASDDFTENIQEALAGQEYTFQSYRQGRNEIIENINSGKSTLFGTKEV